MITIFTTPKDFTDVFEVIQINALINWRSLSSEIQIIIFGDSKGSQKAAEKIGAEYIPEVKCSSLGTPFISDLFSKADKIAKYPLLAFINSDILLPDNFLSTIQITSDTFNKFLLVGHRWDIDIDNTIDFNDKVEKNIFWNRIKVEGKKHACSGIDYFIYKRYQWKNIPDFIIGRDGYDNWLIWKARRMLLPIVDATDNMQVVHQNHPFNSSKTVQGKEVLLNQERDHNKKLYINKTLNLLDCTYRISNGKVIKNKQKDFVDRNLYRLPKIFPEISILLKIYRRFYNWLFLL